MSENRSANQNSRAAAVRSLTTADVEATAAASVVMNEVASAAVGEVANVVIAAIAVIVPTAAETVSRAKNGAVIVGVRRAVKARANVVVGGVDGLKMTVDVPMKVEVDQTKATSASKLHLGASGPIWIASRPRRASRAIIQSKAEAASAEIHRNRVVKAAADEVVEVEAGDEEMTNRRARSRESAVEDAANRIAIVGAAKKEIGSANPS